ncbi:MAG TPA: phosphopyruvate hydratase [Candidatus Saccharibacteria bacterium]|nr:phosphopyruvate hydratase [Candidatus Saccharibacteria bacterium]
MSKPKINKISARMILDSRGNPTIEAVVMLSSGQSGRASVPSGASTGSHEAIELRDGGSRFGGLGVENAINNIDALIAPSLIGEDPNDQQLIDEKMIKLDGTKNKSKLGANAILAVSLSIAKAAANEKKVELYQHIADLSGNSQTLSIPTPMINIVNGGRHAEGASDFQEYMIVPKGIATYPDQIRACSEIFHKLKQEISSLGIQTTVGDEGGFAPILDGGNKQVFDLIVDAISKGNYEPGKDVFLALDIASSEFYANGKYNLKSEDRILGPDELSEYYDQLMEKYPIFSIEDPFSENDYEAWENFSAAFTSKIQIVGDDLLVTNPEFISSAISAKRANSLLVKPNQIGTLSETIKAVSLAKKAGWTTVMSHRSGETEDTSIAHLAVGLGTEYIKAGSMSRSERLAKYNELLRINEYLDL